LRQAGWSRSLLLVLACTLVGCQTTTPPAGSTLPASATSRPAAGMGVIRGQVKVDAGTITAGYRLTQASAAGGRVTARSPGATVEGTVGPDGGYSLEVPGGFDYTLEATVSDGRGGVTRVVSPTPVSVPLAQDPPIVDAASLVTRRTGSIQGLVELKDAKPGETAEGVDVFLSGGTSVVGKAGESGRFALTNVAEGTWNVVVSKPGYKRQVVKGVAVRAGRPAMLDAAVVLERESAAAAGVRGSVQGSTGQAIVGATVSLYPKDRAALGASDAGLDNFTAITDEQGQYEVLNLPAGEYSVQIYRPFYKLVPRRSVTVASGTPQDLGVTKLTSTVTYFGRVSGEVVDEAGVPITGAVAQLDPPVTEAQFADAKGEFTLDRVLPGEYNLTIAAGGYAPVIIPVLVDNAPGFELDTGKTGSYRLSQSSARPFSVRVGKVSLAKVKGMAGFPAIRPVAPVALGDEDYLPGGSKPGGGAAILDPVFAPAEDAKTIEEDFSRKLGDVDESERRAPALREIKDLRLFKPGAARVDLSRARAVAQKYLSERVDGGKYYWTSDARLSDAAPLALLDGFTKEPGSYEFLVTNGKGPAGHIVVNTSRDMIPVPESSTIGTGHQAALLEQFRTEHKRTPKSPVFYRFSSFSWALEDAADGVQSALSVGGFNYKAFRAGERYLMERPGQGDFIKRAWAFYDAPAADARKFNLFWHTYLETKNLTGMPNYRQHTYNGCAVGCGAASWGQLYGYWEQRSRDTIAGAPSTNTSSTGAVVDNANTRSMTEAINEYMGTWCDAALGGATYNTDMYKGRQWGRTNRGLTVGTNAKCDGSDYAMFKHARYGLRDNRPVLIGFRDDDVGGHFVAAYGFTQMHDYLSWLGSDDGYESLRVKTNWSSPTDLTLSLGDNGLDLFMSLRVSVNNP
ncbi:MAG: carboxypeptidase-like regulatory domain-containing protein, partial [Candidatus Sericytochromatia bacterium]|nr:carboxypeptidase-like regulatory domain-containing protein [Candidatus Sericytochromatia bacterium]